MEADPATWQFTFVAGQAEAILGYPAEQWLTRDFWPSILHPDERDAIVRTCRLHTEAGEDHEFEYRAIHRDGRIVWVARDMVSVETHFGRPFRLRGVMIDVTEQKRAEEELERFFRLSPVMLCTATPDGHFAQVNPALSPSATRRRNCSSCPTSNWWSPTSQELLLKPGYRRKGPRKKVCGSSFSCVLFSASITKFTIM